MGRKRERKKEKGKIKRLKMFLLLIFVLAPLSSLYFTILDLRRENFASGRPIVTMKIPVQQRIFLQLMTHPRKVRFKISQY